MAYKYSWAGGAKPGNYFALAKTCGDHGDTPEGALKLLVIARNILKIYSIEGGTYDLAPRFYDSYSLSFSEPDERLTAEIMLDGRYLPTSKEDIERAESARVDNTLLNKLIALVSSYQQIWGFSSAEAYNRVVEGSYDKLDNETTLALRKELKLPDYIAQ